jgi:hypothetical protein
VAVTTFNFDAKLEQKLEQMKDHYGATSKAEVLRKAIALLSVAMDSEQPDGSLIIRQGDKEVRVLVK